MPRFRFLFPSDYFQPKQVDAAYLEQFQSLQSIGHPTSVICLENLGSGSAKIYPAPTPGEKLIYRGWMLTPSDYSSLGAAVDLAGARMWISQAEYLATHYLPNWYPLISDLTPETYCFDADDDLERELTALGWSSFFVKDYVKSLKTSIGSIIHHPSEIGGLIAEMHKFRGTIEGGICVRRVEDFLPETERRYFVINARVFAATPDLKIPEIVQACASRIDSKFFSVDAIECRDGCRRIVEIGDGQVSGLVGWEPAQFADLWHEAEMATKD
jgi:ATP-grasp domain, R2K clade family 3